MMTDMEKDVINSTTAMYYSPNDPIVITFYQQYWNERGYEITNSSSLGALDVCE